MSTRKKPQQELASYFDELLTELSEPVEALATEPTAERYKVITPEVKPPSEVVVKSEDSIEKTSSNGSHVIDPTRLLAQKITSKTASSHIPPTTMNTATRKTAASETDNVLPSLPLSDVGPHSGHPNEVTVASSASSPRSSVLPALSSKSEKVRLAPVGFVEKEDALAKIQQAKLQRLLRSLSPSAEGISIEAQQQLENNFLGNTVTVVDSPEPTITSAPAISTDIGLSEKTATATAPLGWESLSDEWLENGRPVWAQNDFDILMVTVNNVSLALPLQALDAIYPIEEEESITPLFAQAKWFMGLQKTLKGHVKVINSAQFLMPERLGKHELQPFSHSVAINGSGWGLAVNSITQPLTISPNSIRWRKRRSERPWFAGTVQEHMCVLLDIPVLAKVLNSKDSNNVISTSS